MASLDELLADFDAAEEPPLSTGEKVLGASRSYLSGPTFNFADNLEAGIASLFTPLSYNEELLNIRNEQERFKRLTPYWDNALEIGSSLVLNPLDKLGKATQGANKGLTTLTRAVTNPVSQGALAQAGLAEGEDDILMEALKGAGFGTAGSMVASGLGSVAEQASKQADRLKLSAFGVNFGAIQKQLKKMGEGIDELDEVPLLKTVDKFEKAGVINAGEDAITNFKNVLDQQEALGNKLSNVLTQADEVSPPLRMFGRSSTDQYIKSLSGKARETARQAADEEYTAILSQMENGGTLADLQRAKTGLNYKWDQNPYSENVIKKLRSDIKKEIEDRVNLLAEEGLINPKLHGAVKNINGAWGEAAELKDVFTRQLAKDYGGDIVEDAFNMMRTSGGIGSLNIAGAASGNPFAVALGAIGTVARTDEFKNKAADTLRELKTPLGAIGKVLPEIGTSRSTVQAMEAVKGEKGKKATPAQQLKSLKSLLDEFDAIDGGSGSQSTGAKSQSDSAKGQESTQQGSPQKSKRQEVSLSKGGKSEIPSLFDVNDVSGASQSIFDLATEDQLLDAVRKVESNNGKYLKSHAGALGEYQFMPKTAKSYKVNLYDNDPTDDREGARQLLRDEEDALMDRVLALAAYNAGRGPVAAAVKKAGSRKWEDVAPHLKSLRDGKTLTETQNYIPALEKALAEILSRSV